MPLRDIQTASNPEPNTANPIILFPDNAHLQSIFKQYAKNFEDMKNDPQSHFKISKTRVKETEILEKLQISDNTLQIFTDKMSEITHKISTLNKDISLQNQLMIKSKKMLEAAKDEYTESLIHNDKEYTDSIESKFKKYQYNSDVAQAKISATKKAIKHLEAFLKPLKKLLNHTNYQLLRKEFLSIKKEYLQHLNTFKEHYDVYRKILESEKFRRRFENKGDTDAEIYNTLVLDIYAPKHRKY